MSKFAPDVPKSLVDAVESVLNEAKIEPAKPDPAAVARKKKLDALRDKQAEKDSEKEKEPSAVRKIAGKAYGGAKQKDEPELDEELKGGQVKLDKNHNGKLDADDFKKLRAGKKEEGCECKEETDLDEATLSAKAGRAGKDLGKPGKMFAKIAAKAAMEAAEDGNIEDFTNFCEQLANVEQYNFKEIGQGIILTLKRLQFNILEHTLVPKHKVLTEAESAEVESEIAKARQLLDEDRQKREEDFAAELEKLQAKYDVKLIAKFQIAGDRIVTHIVITAD